MPPQPPWHARAARIRRDLDRLPIPVLDRSSIERLFQIERRTAQRLLRTLEGHVSSQVAVVTRETVAAMLDQLLDGTPVPAEAARKHRLADALASLEQEALPRTTAIATVAVTEDQEDWPEGVALAAPDALTIRFRNPEELLGRILALTEMAAGDYAGFARRLAPGDPA